MTKDNLQCFYTEDTLPKVFIAIYSDASGCGIYYKKENGCYSSVEHGMNLHKDWFADAGYLWFIELPDDFLDGERVKP